MAFPTDPIYKFVKNIDGDIATVKRQFGEGDPHLTLHIPFDDNNTHYQEYKAWVAKGNTAEAAD